MFSDAEGDRGRFAKAFDVCIVGAGPAGITLARALAARGFEVALMEGGGFDVSVESQDAYVGDIVGMDYIDLDAVRLRVFGGCSEHWSGRCRAIDAEAFEPMPQRPMAWPIRKADLDPYAVAAAEILDLPLKRQPDDLPAPHPDPFRDIRFQHSAPTRFGQKYRDEIAASPGIAACVNANLVDLTLDADLATVTAAHFRSFDPADPGFAVRARAYCLCLGGFENPRMLLNLTRQKPQGIGNDHDLVGRYFCEHPSRTFAEARFAHPLAIEGYSLAPTREFMLEHGTLGFTLKVQGRDYPPDGLWRALKSATECASPGTRRLAERLLGRPSRCRWGGVEEFLARRWPEDYPTGWVWMAVEQALNPDSRVMLGDEVDAFGLRRIRFDWQLTDLDYHTMQTAALALGEHFAEADIGRIRIEDWLLADDPRMPEGTDIVHGGEWSGGYHQMCTTRMADDPREGVVDRNCRVHGTANLYLGGSSVFGTPSYCNPTFTIVQLALRLGDHLDAIRLARGAL
jgi:choline dehydrogenase-like flavoprotein